MKSVRVGAGQGFYGDTPLGALDLLTNADVQYLCFDALSELTIAILQRDRVRDPGLGYTKDLPEFMRALLPLARRKGVRLITNAGGMNPRAAAAVVRNVAQELGLTGLKVVAVDGEEITTRVAALQSEGNSLRHSGNHAEIGGIADRIVVGVVYLGAQPLVEALRQGADVVITGRVADASLFLAPMVHELGWGWEEWDRLAAGVVLGHLLECAAQCSGGNFSGDWNRVEGMAQIGYPFCDMQENGEAVITKAVNSGGRIGFDTVKEQLLYEVQDPSRYLNPDVIADLTSVQLQDLGEDRVAVTGVHGAPRPESLKAIFGYEDGWMGTANALYSWPQALAKARAAAQLIEQLAGRHELHILERRVEYLGHNALHGAAAGVAEDARDDPTAEIMLRMACRFATREEASRFSRMATPLALNGPPFVAGGLTPVPPRPLFGIWPTTVSRTSITPAVTVLPGDERG